MNKGIPYMEIYITGERQKYMNTEKYMIKLKMPFNPSSSRAWRGNNVPTSVRYIGTYKKGGS